MTTGLVCLGRVSMAIERANILLAMIVEAGRDGEEIQWIFQRLIDYQVTLRHERNPTNRQRSVRAAQSSAIHVTRGRVERAPA
jgi:hypothetical protein